MIVVYACQHHHHYRHHHHYHHHHHRWFERAAAAGNAEGMFNIGAMLLAGNPRGGRNREKAIEYFLRASNGTDPFPFAVYALGNIYSEEVSG